jgi:hypothetical protein
MGRCVRPQGSWGHRYYLLSPHEYGPHVEMGLEDLPSRGGGCEEARAGQRSLPIMCGTGDDDAHHVLLPRGSIYVELPSGGAGA